MAGLEISEDLDLSNLDNKQKIILLDKVFFKILASETDLDFEENLNTYLPKLLLKLATNEEIVRKKVMEILVHVNKRIKSRPNVQLPLNELLDMFNDTNLSSLTFFANFSMIYIKLSFPRLASSDKAKMVEKFLKSLEGKSSLQQDSLISLVIDGIRYLELKPNDSSNVVKYSLQQSIKLRKNFLDYLFYFLLLPYAPQTTPKPVAQVQPSTSESAPPMTEYTPQAAAAGPAVEETPACISEAIYKRLKNNIDINNGDEIEQLKIGILRFLSFNIYEPEEILFHYIVSTSDTRYSVVQIAELHIKRIVGAVDLNDQNIVNKFFSIFLGDTILNQKNQNETNKMLPANTRIRLKLMPYVLRSRVASSTLPQAIQLVFDCLFGTNTFTNQKIKLYAVQFIHLMALNCESEKLSKVGSVLIQGLNKLIAQSKEDGKLRSLAYVAIGKLARKMSGVVASDISIVHNFFSALESEDHDTKMSIQEALVLMIDALKNMKKAEKDVLLTLLFQYVENDVSQCRSMAVKYAFEIFEHDQLESRFLLLLATSDSKEEIRQEAVKYLHVSKDPDGNELKMASFEEWVDFIWNKIQDRLNKKYKLYTMGTHTLAFDINCYQEILTVLRKALAKSAGSESEAIDAKALESAKDQAPTLAKYVAQLGAQNLNSLLKYVNIIKDYTLAMANPLGVYMLLEICSISPHGITKCLYDNVNWFKNQTLSVNEQVRFYSAELWSLILINNILEKQQSTNRVTANTFDSYFEPLLQMNKSILNNSGKQFEAKHGCILSIGYAIGKFYSVIQQPSESQKQNIKTLIEGIGAYLTDVNLSIAAVIALGEVGRNGSLIFNNEDELSKIVECLNRKILTSNETNKVKEKAANTLGFMCLHEIEFLNTKSSNTEKFNRQIMQKLLDSAQAKQIELHMAIGDALVNCALGKNSNASTNTWLIVDGSQKTGQALEADNEDLAWLLDKLLDTYLPSANQHLRQAACFWLLILIKRTWSKSGVIGKNLLKIQDAYMQRLGETDDVTQEVASKGIGVIFDLADEQQKKLLVSRLVETLTGNKPNAVVASAIKITDENQEIFQSEQIKTPEGGNVTTYKELCSLASDLNRPDLVYQFMNLAHHNSIWNTRRGVAFGFNAIAKMSSDLLRPYLATIVPKLFRYQFDPNVKIQQSMTSIWNSFSMDNKKMIDLYLVEILNDIESNMQNSLWRVRESCCKALCDLFKGGRNLEQISGKLGPFWLLLFRLTDDIKESVRTAAEMALKSLQRVTISYSTSVSNASVCQQTVNSVMPILIREGLMSNLNEIRNISVLTIRDLIKQCSREMIKPYLNDMIISLLETLSGYEPPDLNYISMKLGSQEAQEKLDMARISASKNTPMIEIINMNLNYLDDDAMLADLIPKLLEIVKRGLGVSTKAGVCHIFCSLVDQQPQKIANYSGKLLASFVNFISTEQNKTINKYYCNTIGTLAKVAKDSSIENLINKLKDWYLSKEEDGIKLSCGMTLLALFQNNSEIMGKFSKKCIPLAFYAMHEQKNEQKQAQQQQQPTSSLNAQKQTIWDDLFEEITNGTEYAIRTNLEEILNLIRIGLESQSWKMRIQSAHTICTITTKLQSHIEKVYLDQLLKMLISALSTRTWSGKDKILLAISSILINCRLKLTFDNDAYLDELGKSLFKEANKQGSADTSYKIASLRCLSDFLQLSANHLKDVHFEEYWSNILLKYFQETLDSLNKKELARELQQFELFKGKQNETQSGEAEKSDEPMSDDSEQVQEQQTELPATENKNKKDDDEKDEELEELNSKIKSIILETIGKCWTYNNELQEKYVLNVCLLLSDQMNKVVWSNQVLLIKSLDLIFEKWSIELEEKNFDVSIRSIEISSSAVISCLAKTNYSNLKREGLTMLEKIINFLITEKEKTEIWTKLINGPANVETESDVKLKFKFRDYLVNNIVDSLTVLLQQLTLNESSLDTKEKSKTLLKLLYANFNLNN